MKKILIINGHPFDQSFCQALADAYYEGATKGTGITAKLINLHQLKFDPILHKGYSEIQELEADLHMMQQELLAADHIVVVYPVWWGAVPALLKGFLDRTLVPGFAFKYRKGSPLWDRLLKGKTGRLIVTSDGPWWWNRFIYGDPAIKMMKKAVFEFCGIDPVSVILFDEIKASKPQQRLAHLERVKKLGLAGK